MEKRVFFTGEEKLFIKEEVEKKKHILECKKSGSMNVVQKKRAWEEVASSFNAVEEHTKVRTAYDSFTIFLYS